MNSNNDQSQLMVKLFTKNKRYTVADNPYSIPSNSEPESLNALLKGILKEDINEEDLLNELMSAEFDFYINSVYLETSLDEFIKSNAETFTTESIIEIEYTERYPPPEPIDSILTEDWVSAIKGLGENILIGSYNNSVQVWTVNGKCLANLPGHNGPVKAVVWVSNEDSKYKFLSASHDQSVMIWNWNKKTKKLDKADKCVGHTESVECIDLNFDKTKFITGSWDKTIKLWSLLDELADESVSKKTKSDVNVNVKTPVFTLSGHTENVSCCKWMNANNACTGSWDHSIKLWDIFAGQETRTLKSPSKIFLSLDYSPLNELIVAGLNDSHIRVYDPKSNEGNLVKISMTSHTGWVSSVSWSSTDSNLFVSGSYDNKAKLWDIRNSKSSVYDILGHTDKILCTDWSIKDMILTGSADNTFKMYKTY